MKKGLIFWIGLIPLAGFGHGGEEHGQKAGATTPKLTMTASRAEATGEAFEVVAVLAEKKLVLYIDRAADNAPVEDAEVEVESGDYQARAAMVAVGAYEAPAAALAAPGRHLLTVSIQTPDAADLLAIALERPAPAMASTTGQDGRGARDWASRLAVGLLAIGAAVLIWRRYKGA